MKTPKTCVDRQRRPTFLSLFAGCGGFDLGFVLAGFDCVRALDNDASAIKVYNHNFKHLAEKMDLSVPGLRLKNGPVDVLLAGPPCQGFSLAGKRKFTDPRNSLVLRAVDFALQLKPKVFLLENVPGIKIGPHKWYWDSACDKLSKAGYDLTELVLDARHFGLAQMRRRLMLVASLKPWTATLAKNAPVVSLRQVLNDVADCVHDNTPQILDPRTDVAIIASAIPSGSKLSNVRLGPKSIHTWDIPVIFGKTTEKERELLLLLARSRRSRRIRKTGDADPVPARHLSKQLGRSCISLLRALEAKRYIKRVKGCYDLVQTFNGKFRRLEWDSASFTIDTRFGHPRYFLHPDQNRPLTLREAARIQGFPDTFVFGVEKTEGFRLVGNAVPPPIAERIATLVKRHLEE